MTPSPMPPFSVSRRLPWRLVPAAGVLAGGLLLKLAWGGSSLTLAKYAFLALMGFEVSAALVALWALGLAAVAAWRGDRARARFEVVVAVASIGAIVAAALLAASEQRC